MKTVALAILLVLGGGLSIFAQDKPSDNPKSVITKKALQDRLAGLEKGRDQTLADLQAYDGAIQECKYWIGKFEAANKESGKDESAKPKAAPEKKSDAPKKEDKPRGK